MGCGASAEVEKKGYVFRVRLLGGLNLYNNGFGIQAPFSLTEEGKMQGASDPYCVLECSGSKQRFESKVQVHTQNPVWNEEFYFNTTTKAPILTVTVKDKDVLSGDDVLGVAKINLHGLISRDAERTMWTTLEQKGALQGAKGEIGLAVVEGYRTHITAKSGTNVKPMDGFSGSSDCYMTLQVGQQPAQKTEVKGWTLNPVWNQTFTFFVPYGIKSQVAMILYDHDSVGVDQNMGWHYEYFDGKPAKEPRELKVELTGAPGNLEFTVADDEQLEGVQEAGAVTDAIKAAWPREIPTSCTFDCRVLGAYNLAASDHSYAADFATGVDSWGWHEFKEYEGTSDPFAVVTCEGVSHATRHINNTLEPVWNEKFRFVCKDRENGFIKVDVYDHDVVGNDGIGAVQIPLKAVKPGKRQEIWSFLDKGRGEVGIEVIQHHQLHVKVVKCDALPAKDMNGMCDPYIKLFLAGAEYKTRIVRNDRNPWFEEEFRFCVDDVSNQKLRLECWDSDFVLFRQNLSEDCMGLAEIDVENLVPGIPNEMTLPLTIAGRAEGTITVIITEEIPVPESALDELKKKGKEAYENAVRKLSEAKEMVTCLKMPDFDKKEEAEYEVADPKLAPRPRFGRINVDVVAARKLEGVRDPWHVGVSFPMQGKRYKTKDGFRGNNNDINESFEFNVPSRLTGALEFKVFESSHHPYTEWTDNCFANHRLLLQSLNNGDGTIRGSPSDDEWLSLSEGKGEIVVRVFEMFRFQIRVVSATEVSTEKQPYVALTFAGVARRTSHAPAVKTRDEKKQLIFRSDPKWDEQFTYFAREKGIVEFEVVADGAPIGKAQFDLNNVRRGVMHTEDVVLDKGGSLKIEVLEEEKMALLDRVIDAANNAKKLAEGLASEVADAVSGAAAGAASAVSGALGKLF